MTFNLSTDELRAWREQCDVQAAAALRHIEGVEGLRDTWERRRDFLEAFLQHQDAVRANIEFNTIHAPMMRAFKGQDVQ